VYNLLDSFQQSANVNARTAQTVLFFAKRKPGVNPARLRSAGVKGELIDGKK